MLSNYFIIAIRNIKRRLSYSLINVLGLALGLAGSFVMGSWVWQELSYDTHFTDHERIYRISVSFYNSGAFASGPEILNTTLYQHAPEVELATRLDAGKPVPVEANGREFEETPFHADSAWFQLFSYEFIAGDPGTALDDPHSVVLTESLAEKYFGRTDVLGMSLLAGADKVPYLITGVVAEKGDPTHIPATLWFPMELSNSTNWTSAFIHSYVKLREGATLQQLEDRLEHITEQWVYPTFKTDIPYDEWKELDQFGLHVVALGDIHLDPDMRFEFQPGGNRANVWVFLVISLLLVVIAAINFINLSTAQSSRRAKEVGIRKVMGTARENLVLQYLTESVVMSSLAMVLGVGLAELFLILFENFTNEQLVNGIFNSGHQIVTYIAGSLAIGILAGIYPAFYLSQFRPAEVLKKSFGGGQRSSGFRNILVIVQFTMSIALITCSLLVYQQLRHLRNVDIGLDRNNVLTILNAKLLGKNREAFKQSVLSRSEVISASFNKRLPAGNSVWIYTFQSDRMDEAVSFQTFVVDHEYLPTMGLRLIDGRNFSDEIASDSSAVILNESAAREMLLQDPVGAVLKNGATVVGMVEDFSYQSYYDKPGPVVLKYDQEGYRLSVKVDEAGITDFLSFIEQQWNSFSPDEPVSYTFLDQSFEKLMDKEKTLGKTITFFTSIAVFISCLGLFGLAAFTTTQRRREIGIRKVMGAAISDIVLLLNRNYTQLVAISVVVAVPLAWYFIHHWLQNFEYRIEIGFAVFLISGLTSVIIAWLTVGYLSFKAAIADPVDTLREE